MGRLKTWIILLIATLPLLGLMYVFWHRTRDTRELDGLVAMLPDKPETCAWPHNLPLRMRMSALTPRLTLLFTEASRFGVGGTLGERLQEMKFRSEVLTEIEGRHESKLLTPEDISFVGESLRADLARAPDWNTTLHFHRLSWLHWLIRVRRGGEIDETEVPGGGNKISKVIGKRRIKDPDILAGWRAIERFYDQAKAISLDREDFNAALDACFEGRSDPTDEPVTAHFAKYATRDLKAARKRYAELRQREELLLETLEE